MSHTVWMVASTGDGLRTDDHLPVGRVRDRIRRDAARWARQGLTFESVTCERDAEASDVYVVTGAGYQLRATQREGFWPVDALLRAATDDWCEA